MSRDEKQTCRELIEPALKEAGWSFDSQVEIGPGRVNLTGSSMYDDSQRIVVDYMLRLWKMPLAILEAKAEGEDAADGIQQGSRYAKRLGLRFSISSNGRRYIITDNKTGAYESYNKPPSPGDILHLLGRNIGWEEWRAIFEAPWYEDQVTRRKVRPYQEMAIFESLYRFSQGEKRVLLLMATGTGKTFTVFQLAWKLLSGSVLKNNRILFLTDRNSLKDQAYRAFAAFDARERVVVDKDTVARGEHLVGKIYFANYQNFDEDYEGKKLYEHFAPDFFDLVVVDECHRSGFGDWFGVLEHFGTAYQLGLTAILKQLRQDVLAAAHRAGASTATILRPRWSETEVIVVLGDPTVEIVHIAEQTPVDMIVLGTRGLTRRERWFVGSTSLTVARYAPCPVMVVRGRTGRVRRVLVAVDGSETARAALRFVRIVHRPDDAHVGLLHVLPAPRASGGRRRRRPAANREPGPDPRPADADAVLADAASVLGETVRPVERLVSEGDPAREIVRIAEDRDVDLVVVGARGLGTLQRLLLAVFRRLSCITRPGPC